MNPAPSELCAERVVVSCNNADGDPDLYSVIVVTTRAGRDEGEHYESAKYAAERNGYEDVGLAYDRDDCAGALMPLFARQTASWVGRDGREVSDRPACDTSGAPVIPPEETRYEHPRHRRYEWKYEVANGYTLLGYWEWVAHREESE